MPRGRRRHKDEAAEPEVMSAEGREETVRDLEDMYSGVRDRLWGMFELPDEFGKHLRASRREFLLAIRSLIDARIEAIEDADRQREAGRRGRVHIE